LTTRDLTAGTLAELRTPWWRRIALLWFALTWVSDLAFSTAHPPGSAGIAGMIALGALTALLFLWLAAAALRRAAASARSPWRIDGSFLFYAALHVVLALAIWFLTPLIDDRSALGASLLGAALPLLLMAPLAPWLVAVAVERPLALSPRPFLKQADSWFPPLLLLTVALLLPLSLVQFWWSTELFEPARGATGLGLLHALMSTLAEMASLTLALTAYRSVAEG
jgi:hypothetical protein